MERQLVFLATILGTGLILLFCISMVLATLLVIRTQFERRLSHLKDKSIDLVIAHSSEYYIPLSASLGALSATLRRYMRHASDDNQLRVFYYYSYYVYRLNRVQVSGVPLPFIDEERDEAWSFSKNLNLTLNLPGLSIDQRRLWLNALVPNGVKEGTPADFDEWKSSFRTGTEDVRAFEGLLRSENVKDFHDALVEMQQLLSSEIHHLSTITHVEPIGVAVAEAIRDAWNMLRTIKESDIAEGRQLVGIFRLTAILTALFVGFSYLMVFAPLAWHSAVKLSLNPLDILLFVQVPSAFQQSFEAFLFPDIFSTTARPMLFSIGACAGAVTLAAGIAAMGNARKNAMTVRGLSGALIVMTLAGYFLGWLPFRGLAFRLVIFKFGYVLAAFMFLTALPDILGRDDLKKAKYEKFLGGLYGLIAGWIISKGFGANATIYNSFLFYVFWFLAMAAEESLRRFLSPPLPKPLNELMTEPLTFSRLLAQIRSEKITVLKYSSGFIVLTFLFHVVALLVYNYIVKGRI